MKRLHTKKRKKNWATRGSREGRESLAEGPGQLFRGLKGLSTKQHGSDYATKPPKYTTAILW
jgi:hypothetical protein